MGQKRSWDGFFRTLTAPWWTEGREQGPLESLSVKVFFIYRVCYKLMDLPLCRFRVVQAQKQILLQNKLKEQLQPYLFVFWQSADSTHLQKILAEFRYNPLSLKSFKLSSFSQHTCFYLSISIPGWEMPPVLMWSSRITRRYVRTKRIFWHLASFRHKSNLQNFTDSVKLPIHYSYQGPSDNDAVW